jgi:hypothetical protein
MATNLMTASNQWSSRPDDERYWTLDSMHMAAHARDLNRERIAADPKGLNFDHDGYEGLLLNIPGKNELTFTDWSFKQISAKLGAPAEYLQSLPAAKAADLLNYHLQDNDRRRYFAKDCVAHVSQGRVECLVSNVYGYIPNHKIIDGLQALESKGWIVPPGRPNSRTNPSRHRKATAEDVARWKAAGIGWGLGVGSELAPSGLYLGDRNMFAFLVKGGGEIDCGTGQVLQRGCFFQNSEVGAGACTFTMFAYDHVCGNHIVWDVKEVKEVSIRHLGKQAEARAIEAVAKDLDAWIADGTRGMVRKIELAKATVLGDTQQDVVESIFSNRKVKVSLKDLNAAYYLAAKHDDTRVNPRSVWGMVTGITRLSQEIYGNADKRTGLDAQVPNLLAMVN